MSNQERAAEVILEAENAHRGHTCDLYTDTHVYAKALADAGLLMPDLPAPELVEEGESFWYWDSCGIGVGKPPHFGGLDVRFWDSEPGGVSYISAEGARELAYALLAAAKLAEEQE